MRLTSVSSPRTTSRPSSRSLCERGSPSSPLFRRFWGTRSSYACIPTGGQARRRPSARSARTTSATSTSQLSALDPSASSPLALDAFHERMGVIEIIGVDPDYQRRGVGARLTEFAADHMRRCGMNIAVVETGADPGHAPARALYGEADFTLLPIARYFRLLD